MSVRTHRILTEPDNQGIWSKLLYHEIQHQSVNQNPYSNIKKSAQEKIASRNFSLLMKMIDQYKILKCNIKLDQTLGACVDGLRRHVRTSLRITLSK